MAMIVERPSLTGWLLSVLRHPFGPVEGPIVRNSVVREGNDRRRFDDLDPTGAGDELTGGPCSLTEYRDRLDWLENQPKRANRGRARMG